MPCADRDAYDTAVELARKEGISAGFSGGAAVFVALAIAAELGSGKRVVATVPDAWERYSSVQPPGHHVTGFDFII